MKKKLFKKGVANDLVSEQVELYQTIVYKNPDYSWLRKGFCERVENVGL